MGDKLAIIGLDGVRLDVIKRFRDDLPTLDSMLLDGASGNLQSVLPGPHSGAAWTSFSTGTNPGKHGVADWRTKDGYSFFPATRNDVATTRFWDYLSDAGHTVGIFNIPLTSPPTPVNGVLVSSWTASLDTYTYPESFQQKIKAVGYRRKADFYTADDPLGNLFESIEGRRRGFEMFFNEYDWDLFVGMFYETEQAHHQFASFLDEEHPLYDETYENKVKQVYEKIDTELTKLFETIGDETVFVISDHGFCPIYEQINLNRILERKGYFSPPEQSMTTESAHNRMLLGVVRRLKEFQPVRSGVNFTISLPLMGDAVDRIINRYQRLEYGKAFDANWAETTAFNAYEHGGIFLNKKGDNPEGIVDESELDELVERLITDLEDDEYLAERTDAIYRREELFHGDCLDDLPEVIVKFKEGYIGQWVYDEQLSMSPAEIRDTGKYIGFHTLDGLFLARGPEITNGRVEGMNIMDIAPTALHFFDHSVPNNMDGNLLKEVFERGSEFNTREVTDMSPNATDTATRQLTDDEMTMIEENLREMGYK